MNKPDWSSIRMAHPQHVPPEVVRDTRLSGVLFLACVLAVILALVVAAYR